MTGPAFGRLLLASLFFLLSCSHSDGTLSATGTLEFTETDLSPDLTSRLITLRAQEGDQVKAGDTVAVLSASGMSGDIARLEAQVKDASAQLKDLVAGARPEEIASATADLRRAESEASLAGADLKRIEPLAAAGTLPAQRGDEARAAVQQANERLNAAQQALRLLQHGPRPDAVQAARARVLQAEAALAAQQQRAGQLSLVALTAGTVRGTWFEPGELVPAGRPVLTLADARHPWVRVYVKQDAFTRITVGQQASAKLDADSTAIPARVVAMSDKAEYTPRVALTDEERADMMFWIKVAVLDSTGHAKAGLPVTVTFSTTPR